MRSLPTCASDRKDAKRLGVQPWMLALLKLNPSYTCWGPGEDYMMVKGDEGGWSAAKEFATWAEFGPWGLDDLNELVHFYFEVDRASKQCPTCGGSGYHPDAQWVSESFYGHSTPFRAPTYNERAAVAVMDRFGGGGQERKVTGFPSAEVLARYKPEFRTFCEAMRNGNGEWHDKVTQDEVDVLLSKDRLWDLSMRYDAEKKERVKVEGPVTADMVNRAQHGRGLSGHDAINRGILIRVRCERYGIPITCPDCDGHGHVFTSDHAHVNVVLWYLHPRKGCSRGVRVSITQADVPAVRKLLREAAKRNAKRFDKVVRARKG